MSRTASEEFEEERVLNPPSAPSKALKAKEQVAPTSKRSKNLKSTTKVTNQKNALVSNPQIQEATDSAANETDQKTLLADKANAGEEESEDSQASQALVPVIKSAASEITTLTDTEPPKRKHKTKAGLLETASDTDNAILGELFHRIFRQLKVVPSLQDPLIVGVTSSLRGEGRTLTALGLAIAISQQIPYPVLLLEADLERPVLAEDLKLPNQGLAEYLQGELEFDDLIRSSAIADLELILAGDCKNQPLKALRSERLNNLFNILSQQYAAVIVDMPPMSMTAESTRMVSLVDKVLMVVEAGSTPAKLVKTSLEFIPEDKRIGVILNRSQKPFGPFQWLARFFQRFL